MNLTKTDQDQLVHKISVLRENISQTILGAEQSIDLILMALLADGHVLIQGAPGMGKTSLAKSLAQSINGKFRRIQFTPDLLPADILGFSIYNQKEHNFVFKEGAIFTNILLADEINRGTPRVQSALLEAMNERQVSIDSMSYQLDRPYFVIATQNNLSSSGTFPLPDSQLDRFMFSIDMKKLTKETHREVLKQHLINADNQDCPAVISLSEISQLQAMVKQISISDALLSYMAAIVHASHEHDAFMTGISSRGSIALMRAAQARAFTDFRQNVYPDDIKNVIHNVFKHRLQLKNRLKKSVSLKRSIQELVDSIKVP